MTPEIVWVCRVLYGSDLSQFASFETRADAELFALQYLDGVPYRIDVLVFRVDRRAPVC